MILWQCLSREEQEDQHPPAKPKSEKQTGLAPQELLSYPVGHTPAPQLVLPECLSVGILLFTLVVLKQALTSLSSWDWPSALCPSRPHPLSAETIGVDHPTF